MGTSSCAFVTGPSHAAIAAPPSALDAHEVMFMSASGNLIRGWLSPGVPGDGAVLLLHGVGANRESMNGRALFLHRQGFTILAPDFEGNGESFGDHVTFGARESLDAAAAMQYLRAVTPGERVGVIGVSMGGAAALLGDHPVVADAFVLESVYPTIRQAVSNRLGAWLGPLGGVARLFTSAVIHRIDTETGVTESQLQPISRISAVRAPVLLITGTADRYTPLVEAESLFARARAPKSFWAVPGATHEDLYTYAPAEYERRVGGFLINRLRAQGAAVVGANGKGENPSR
jgi:pimeloyl-ACP methyl ester carboxylesterase